jgi:hypothetical protein
MHAYAIVAHHWQYNDEYYYTEGYDAPKEVVVDANEEKALTTARTRARELTIKAFLDGEWESMGEYAGELLHSSQVTSMDEETFLKRAGALLNDDGSPFEDFETFAQFPLRVRKPGTWTYESPVSKPTMIKLLALCDNVLLFDVTPVTVAST